MTNYNAAPGVDNIDQGSGPDSVTVTAQNQLDFGDTFIGGTGTDIIIAAAIGAGVDLHFEVVGNVLGIGFRSYEGLVFVNGSGFSNAFFVANQFGGGGISTALEVRGVSGTQQFIHVLDANNFSAAKWKLTTWEAQDGIRIEGNANGTSLTGSARDDQIFGNAGADILTGGRGSDFFQGGDDADRFRFTNIKDSTKGAPDQISDFEHFENDRIDLRAIDANTHLAGNQNFHFIGAKKFHHKEGEVHFVPKNGGTFVWVEGDVNGDGRADFRISVGNGISLASLAKDDFIL
jgi:Ca2+-binding RTX toxin-like protein